jgi:ActD protein
MREMKNKPYGLLAEFDNPEDLLHATRKAYEEGYRRMDAYAPFHIEGLPDALGFHRSRVSLLFLIAALIGGIGGFFLQYYIAKIDYPIIVGGRPLNSWPAFIPITFELTVLCSGVIGFIGMLIMNKLPTPYHPVFNNESFRNHASTDRLYLCIESEDPRFDPEGTQSFLQQLNPKGVSSLEE